MSRMQGLTRVMRVLACAVVVLATAAGVRVPEAVAASGGAPSTLSAGQSLSSGQELVSPSGAYQAVVQGDGNFVVYGPKGAIWWTGTNGPGGRTLAMQTDGNLVIYAPQGAVWSSSTAPSSGDRLVMQSDGNLVIYGSAGALWAKGQLLGPSPAAPTDDYPAQWRNVPQDSVFDTWREYNRECTSFVAWRLHSRDGFEMPFYDNASNWGPRAQALGFTVDSNPKVGSVAWSSTHVAWVQSVSGSSVTIEDYNWGYTGKYGTRVVSAGSYKYIHFKY